LTISDLYKETGEKCLGYRRKQKSKDWITLLQYEFD
jgi:hypothetical protein